jgi:TolA-binding protein
LEADVYRKLNRTAEAVSSYEKIGSIETLPVDQKRLALLKTVELLSTSGATSNALARIESYLGTHTNEPAADLLKIKAGELWIEQFRRLTAKGNRNGGATNALAQARGHLLGVISQYTNSAHLGRAWLNLGWCLWEEGTGLDRPARIQESEGAFRNAAEKLTRSDDQALAFFKIGDAELFLKNPAGARSNYVAVVQNYTDLPQVRNALLGKAYRQLIRSCLELKDFLAASGYLTDFRKHFPNDPLTEETLFEFGQALANDGRATEARKVFEDFLSSYPGSALGPEVRFAEARSFGAEGELDTALRKTDEWLRTYTNHMLGAAVEFRRARLLEKAGQRTNALTLFTNFVVQYPTNALAPAAQLWVGDYYYEQEQWPMAEQNYQRVFQNTNWLNSGLGYEARLMAAKTAFKRQGYNDARSYLTNLINALSVDTNAPAELSAEAYFVLGDVFLEEPITGSTNAVQNFIEAAKVFDRIATQYPSNKLAVLALGKKGDCHLQLASMPAYVESYRDATNAYMAVLNSKVADVPVAAWNQAEVGLGLAFKNMAEGRPAAEREPLQRTALDHFLNVVYARKGKVAPDPYYLKLAGLEAGRLAESMGNTGGAMGLYNTLIKEAPSLKTFWEARISSLQQRLAAQ